MEEEEKNSEQDFLKKQENKGKEKVKKEGKKVSKKIIASVVAHLVTMLNTFGIPLMIAIILITLFTGFLKIIGKNKVEKASDAKELAISYALETDTEENDDSNSSSAIKISYNNGTYIISHKYTNKEDIDNIKDEIGIIGKDVSDFTDFEIGIIGALMENGLDIQSYTTEQLKCLPLFIKAEACTMYLDLRPNSEKFDSKGNYQPQKLKNLKENEIPGVILVQRTNTSEESPRPLEYIDLKSFNDMVSQSDLNVLNYFTIDENNNLVIAKWEYKKVEIEGECPSGVASEVDEYTIKVEKRSYSKYVKKYTMPFDFLMQLLITTDEADFCKALTDIVADSKIVINIQEEETRKAKEDVQTYTIYTKEEKTVSYDVDLSVEGEDGSTSTSSQSDSESSTTETSRTYNFTVKTITITHEYTFEIKEVDNWLIYCKREYKKPTKEETQEGPDTIEILGEYGSPSVTVVEPDEDDSEAEEFKNNKESEFSEDDYDSVECSVSEIETKIYTKTDEEHIVTVQIEKYVSDPNPTIRPHIYGRNEETGELEKFLLIYDKYEYTRAMMDSISAWLFDMMKSNENTIDLIDSIKYLLYLYDGTDHGVTEIDTSIFELPIIEFDTQVGTKLWWPIGSVETTYEDGKLFAKGDPALGKSNISRAGLDISKYNGYYGTHQKGAGSAVDIAGDGQSNKWNIISVGKGTVTKIGDGIEEGDQSGNNGMGNYVMIDYGNNVTVCYYHLYKGSIIVKEGDVVDYGQVIGKMGNSGNSTGTHLHIEVRVNGETVDTTEYIDPQSPRPILKSLIRDWIWKIEGGSQYINGTVWTVFVDPEGNDPTMNLAHGMVIAWEEGGDSWYPEIIPGKIHAGDTVTEEQANKIWEIKIQSFIDSIDAACIKYNVTLNSYQRDALISYIYRVGNGANQANSLVSSYKTGGNVGLWNYMKEGYHLSYQVGTKRRIAEEYELFVKGDYNYNPGEGITKYNQFCINPNI